MNSSQENCQPPLPYRFEFEPDEFEAIKACNDEHGFAIVKGLLSAEHVSALKAEVLRVVDPEGKLPPGGNATLSAYIEEAREFWKLLEYQPYLGTMAHADSAQRFIDTAPDSIKPYIQGYTGPQGAW